MYGLKIGGKNRGI